MGKREKRKKKERGEEVSVALAARFPCFGCVCFLFARSISDVVIPHHFVSVHGLYLIPFPTPTGIRMCNMTPDSSVGRTDRVRVSENKESPKRLHTQNGLLVFLSHLLLFFSFKRRFPAVCNNNG